jgi:hypothetical protein
MTVKTSISLTDAEVEALRTLIDRRRAEPFIDLDEGEAQTRASLMSRHHTRQISDRLQTP